MCLTLVCNVKVADKWKCDACSRSFNQKDHLKRHISKKKECLDKLISSNQLQSSQSEIHTGPEISSETAMAPNISTGQHQVAYSGNLWTSHKICFDMNQKVWLCNHTECGKLLRRSYIEEHIRNL